MGPRLFCAEIPGGCDLRGSIHPHMRGDNCNRHSGPRAASMGPLFSAWKSGGENETDQHDRPLQWGHSFQLGNSGGTSGFWRLPTASMGPRLFRRGNGLVSCPGNMTMAQLQWGHVFSDVEIGVVVWIVSDATVASMGPRLFRRGNLSAPYACLSQWTASMGPRLFRRGNGVWVGFPFLPLCCFNGATSFQTWKSTRR